MWICGYLLPYLNEDETQISYQSGIRDGDGYEFLHWE